MRRILAAGALALLAAGAAAIAQPRGQNEEFQYRWQLGNFLGSIAGLFLPNHGDGSLTFKPVGDGHLRSELTITSNAAKQGEYFTYGSEIDARSLRPIKAWSSYSWRGETKSKEEPIDQEGVLDIASGIYSIRQSPPTTSRRMEIWSDGKVYPVVVLRLGVAGRRSTSGKPCSCGTFRSAGSTSPTATAGRGSSTSGSPATRRRPRSRACSRATSPTFTWS